MRLVFARGLAAGVVMAGLIFAAWSLAVNSPSSPWYQARWKDIRPGFERMEFVSVDGTNILLYAFNPADVTMRIENSLTPARVKAWSNGLTAERLVVNGFYFLEDNSPAGLLISDGQPSHKQEFDLDKSGLVKLAPDFAIIDTSELAFDVSGVLEAGQSYPFLLKHGNKAIAADSGLAARRTFIATDTSGQMYVGLVWRDQVSLFELMHELAEIDIPWDNVINLDGGPSTGISVVTDGFSETLDSAAPVPNVIVIEPK